MPSIGIAEPNCVPMLARAGSNLLLVWTQDAEPTRLRAVKIPIGEIPAATKK